MYSDVSNIIYILNTLFITHHYLIHNNLGRKLDDEYVQF